MPDPIAVINPGGRDRDQSFADGAGSPDHPGHPPVNFHAYAACTRGQFLRSPERLRPDVRRVLLLLRADFGAALRCLETLRARRPDAAIAVSLKECGTHQVAAQLATPAAIRRFQTLCREADAAVAATPETAALFADAGAQHSVFIPTPYPVDRPEWDFSLPAHERRGILVGTREFDVPSRNHVAAILLAARLASATGQPLTILNSGGRKGRALIAAVLPSDTPPAVADTPLPYPAYLRLLARHRIILQLDRSAVPGQVAGDATLCRTLSIGGDGAIDRLAFPELSGPSLGRDALFASAARLCSDDAAYAAAVDDASRRATQHLAFDPVALALDRFFSSLPPR